MMRVGVIGLGWAATSLHVPAISRTPGAELAGGCDSSPERREEWARVTGTPAFSSPGELLGGAALDVVVVATPPSSHADLCVQALEQGKHVFCEKPFVSDRREADDVLAAAARAERQVAVNHEFRGKPIFRALRERIESGQAGRLVFCQIWQLMDLAPWDEPVVWRRQMHRRTLFEGGVHLVDLLLMLFDAVPEAVYARHSSGLGPHDADAVHLVTLEFPEGRLAQITIDRLCQAGTRYVEIRADCEEASLRASLGGRAQLHIGKKRAERGGVRLELASGGLAWEERGLQRRTLARNPRDSAVRATADLLGRVIRAFEQNIEPPSSGRAAANGLAVIEAAYESAASGRRVELSRASHAT